MKGVSRGWRTAAIVLALLVPVAAAVGALVEGTAVPVVQRTVDPTATLAGLTWRRLDIPIGQYDNLTSVIAGGPGLIAAGSSDTGPAVWASSDGERWESVRDPSVNQVTINSLIAYQGQMLAGGNASPGTAPAVWASTDGRHWARTLLPAYRGHGFTSETVTSLAAGSAGLVAAGRAFDDTRIARPLLWHSPDGVTWTAVDLSSVFLPGTHGADLAFVTAAPWGFEALGGSMDVSTGALVPLRLLLLSSADGVRWSQVPEPDAAFGATPPTNRCDVTALVSDGGRVFAAGVQTYVDLSAPLHRVAEPELWSSAEGTSWSPLQRAGTPTDGCGWEGRIMTVAREGGRLLAAGNVGLGGFATDSEAAIWASSDGGAHWSALTQSVDLLDPGQANPVIRSMAALGHSVVAVGSSDLGHGLAWRAIPSPAPSPAPVIGRDVVRASA